MVDSLNQQFAPTTAKTGPPGMWSSLAKGAIQGARDVTDWPAEQLAKGTDTLGITQGYADQLKNQDTASRSDFNNSTAGNIPALVGRIGGQLALSMPILGAGGKLAGAAAKGAADLMGEGSTAANDIRGISNFLSGNAGLSMAGAPGLALRVGSRVAKGALLGGTNALILAPSAMDAPDLGGAGGDVGSAMKGGAEAGALVGGVLPGVGAVLSPAVKIAESLKDAATDASDVATNKSAINLLTKALKSDGMTTDEAMAKLKTIGPQATLADVGGANVRNLGETVANSPGEGSQLAQFLNDRIDSQPERLSQSLKTATGQNGDTFGQLQALMTKRSQEAAPLYQKALSNPVPPDDTRLAQFLADPTVKKGFDQGLQISRLEALSKGEPFDATAYTGDPALPVPASMKAADAAKKGLDDMVEAYRDPITGKLNLDSQGRALAQVRGALIDHLDSINPDYAAARQSWSGPSHAMDLVNMGQRVLTTDPSVTAKTVSDLPAPDKAFFLNGVTKAIQDKIDGTPDGASAVRRIFGNSAVRAKIQFAFGDPTAYQNFADQMNAEAQYAATRNAILGGSQTARRLAGMSETGVNWTPHVVNALTGSPGEATVGVLKDLGNYLSTPSSKQMAAVGKVLFNPDNAAVRDAIERGKPSALGNLLTDTAEQGKKGIALGLTQDLNQRKGGQ